MNKTLSDIELPCGGCIETPDDDGRIRRRDSDGNTQEVRDVDDDDWQEWADLFDLTPKNFAEED